MAKGITRFNVVQANAFIGMGTNPFGAVWFVNGDTGVDGNTGTVNRPFATIQRAVDVSSAYDTVVVQPKLMAAGATDPESYAETIIIPATTPNLTIMGIGNRTQGGLPQIKIGGSSTTAMLTIRAPGCSIQNLGFNGASSTGGGILLDDDGSTKTAFGTEIANCHFKNCQASGNASTGGAIMWAATGGAWQVLIRDNLFYNCRAGIVLIGTSSSRPQDVVIERCTFHASANTTIDCDLFLSGGSGIDGLTINDCQFGAVDVPAYASSPAAARYVSLTGCEGHITNCTFACISEGGSAKTFGDAGTGGIVPTTVRMSACYGESATADTSGEIFRT